MKRRDVSSEIQNKGWGGRDREEARGPIQGSREKGRVARGTPSLTPPEEKCEDKFSFN